MFFRIGKQEAQKTRPLKIILHNKKQRKEIIDKSYQIKKIPSSSEYKKCIITKDLTVRQRDENKARRLLYQKEKKKDLHTSTYEEVTITDNSNNSTILEASAILPQNNSDIFESNTTNHNLSMDLGDNLVHEETIIGGLLLQHNRTVNNPTADIHNT